MLTSEHVACNNESLYIQTTWDDEAASHFWHDTTRCRAGHVRHSRGSRRQVAGSRGHRVTGRQVTGPWVATSRCSYNYAEYYLSETPPLGRAAPDWQLFRVPGVGSRLGLFWAAECRARVEDTLRYKRKRTKKIKLVKNVVPKVRLKRVIPSLCAARAAFTAWAAGGGAGGGAG